MVDLSRNQRAWRGRGIAMGQVEQCLAHQHTGAVGGNIAQLHAQEGGAGTGLVIQPDPRHADHLGRPVKAGRGVHQRQALIEPLVVSHAPARRELANRIASRGNTDIRSVDKGIAACRHWLFIARLNQAQATLAAQFPGLRGGAWRPSRFAAKVAGIGAPQGRRRGVVAHEDDHRWLALKRLGWVGVQALEVFVKPAQALVAVVHARQGPGVFGVVVGPGADDHALGALQLGIGVQHVIAIPVAPTGDQKSGRFDPLMLVAQQTGLPKRTVLEVVDVSQAPGLGVVEPLPPHRLPLLAEQFRGRRCKVVGGHQRRKIFHRKQAQTATRAGHAGVPV